MESKKINQLATELTPALSDLTIIGDPTTGISKKITLSQMASLFTGTVEEYANLASFPLVGAADTIYIALDTNVLYRWDTGLTSYVELSPNIINSLVFNDANGFDGTISLVGSVATLTITTALTTGSIGFIGASGALLQDNANLFWDDSNNRLGIGTNAPTTAIDTFGSGIITRVNGTSTNNAFIGFASAGTNKWSVGNVQSDHRFRIYNEATTSELVSVLQTGEFGIGIANPTTKLHIDGGSSALIANLDANVSVAKSISFRSDNSNRINLEVSGTESGSNAGANFFLRTYTDAGSLLETPFSIVRSTGVTTLKSLTLTNALSIANGGTGSTTQNFVDLTTTQSIGGAKTFTNILTVSLTNGSVLIRDNGSTQIEANIRHTSTRNGVISFTENGVADRWAIGTKPSDGTLYFSSNFDLSAPKFTLSSAGVGVFSSSLVVNGLIYGRANSSFPASGLGYYALKTNNFDGERGGLTVQVSSSTNTLTDALILNYLGATTLINTLTNRIGHTIFGAAGGYTTGDNPFIGLGTTASDTFGAINAPFGDRMRFNAYHGFEWYTSNSGASGTPVTKMLMTSSGNLLINSTTDNGYKLQVNGFASVTGVLFALGTSAALGTQNREGSFNYLWIGYNAGLRLYNDGTPAFLAEISATTGVYTALSDINKKKDFEESTIGLNEILNLKPTLYRMKNDDESMQKQLGFIAQEVKHFIPQAYVESGDDNNKFIGLQDRPIIAALVKSVQEQQKQIEELKALINK
jgi:hypothetical protein